MDFGFTNDGARHAAAVAWRLAAQADGWEVNAGSADEPIERYAHLSKDGWVAHVMARVEEPGGRWAYQASVTVWASDGLQIMVPTVYPGFSALQALTRHCGDCGKHDVETTRVSFAGRVCLDCLPAARKHREYPGWSS